MYSNSKSEVSSLIIFHKLTTQQNGPISKIVGYNMMLSKSMSLAPRKPFFRPQYSTINS